MAYIIAEPCVNVKDGACVDVCPVDCIHPTKGEPDYDQHNQLYIDPEECIDCGPVNWLARSLRFSRRAPCRSNGGSISRSMLITIRITGPLRWESPLG